MEVSILGKYETCIITAKVNNVCAAVCGVPYKYKINNVEILL